MKYRLLAAVAAGALISSPAFADRDHHDGARPDGESTIEGDAYASVVFKNKIDTSIETDVEYNKDVALEGTVELVGQVQTDSSAVAVNDVKQLQNGVSVTYREENELNGENGFVSRVFGPGISEHGQDPDDGLTDGVQQPRIRAGFFAPIINTVTEFDVDVDGNVGVNLAAGYFNEQMNSASLATSDNVAPDAKGGWAEASSTALQELNAASQLGTPGEVLDEDNPDAGGAGNNFRDRNTVNAIGITGSGNLGINVAAGSLNQQANLLTLAVANDSTLAEANAGLIQSASLSFVEQQDSINLVTGPTVGGSGNIGINLAAGVGNQQLNVLTIASSAANDTPVDNPGGGGSVFDPS